MTWTLDRTTGEVIDHTGAVVTTLNPPYVLPDDVFDAMQADIESEGVGGGLNPRQVRVIRDAIFEQIDVIEPEGQT
jgi:hypothetical protein